jgi:hypothetical protein
MNILQKHKILEYHRYVDDLLLVYNNQITDISNTVSQFNGVNPKLQFTIEKRQLYKFSRSYNYYKT